MESVLKTMSKVTPSLSQVVIKVVIVVNVQSLKSNTKYQGRFQITNLRPNIFVESAHLMFLRSWLISLYLAIYKKKILLGECVTLAWRKDRTYSGPGVDTLWKLSQLPVAIYSWVWHWLILWIYGKYTTKTSINVQTNSRTPLGPWTGFTFIFSSPIVFETMVTVNTYWVNYIA